MKRAVRRMTRVGYTYVAKPLLFKLHPDGVHRRLVVSAKIVQKIPVARQLPKLWSHQSPHLEQVVFGMKFTNPIGVSAGFDKNVDMVSVLRNVGFGFMIGGSVTADPCDGNPKPWFYRLPKTKSLVVYAGLPNQGIERICSRIEKYPAALFVDFPVGVSVAKTNSQAAVSDERAIADYCMSLRRLEQGSTVPFYEINISCPNTFGGEPFTTPERLERLLEAIDALQLARPVTIKMPIDVSWKEFQKLLDVIMRHTVAAVTIGNLRKDRTHLDLKDSLPAHIQGNFSGLLTRDMATLLIRKTHQYCGHKLVIIGVGGVFSAQDAYEKIQAGASLVALITGMIFEGPQLVGEITAELEQLLKQDGYTSIHQAIGTAAK